MTADLTISDLAVLDGEPRIKDLVLAERLGFERPRAIRQIIERNTGEIIGFGGLPRRVANPRPQGGRPSQDTYLNESQALLVCMFARTPNAAAVRRQLIEVFVEWRRRQAEPAPVTPPASGSVVATVEARLSRVESHLAAVSSDFDRSYAAALADYIEGKEYGAANDGLHLGPSDLRVFVAVFRRSAWKSRVRGSDRPDSRVSRIDSAAVWRRIAEAGTTGIARTDLSRFLAPNKLQPCELDHLLAPMIASGEVRVLLAQNPRGGPRTRYYVAISCGRLRIPA